MASGDAGDFVTDNLTDSFDFSQLTGLEAFGLLAAKASDGWPLQALTVGVEDTIFPPNDDPPSGEPHAVDPPIIAPVPYPASAWMLLAGVAGLAAWGRRKSVGDENVKQKGGASTAFLRFYTGNGALIPSQGW